MTHARGAECRPDDDGFTLVEVVAALVVFVIVSTAAMAILIQALRVVRDNADRVMAANIARSQIEYLRLLGTSAIPIGLTQGAVPGGQSSARVDARLLDPEFTIRTTSNWAGVGQTENACTAASPGQAFLRVSVEVSSANLRTPVTADTVLFPDSDYQVSNSGSVAIAIVDQVGQPVSNVSVVGNDPLHSGNNFSLTSGSDGCIYVPNRVASGSLGVTVARSGYVAPTPTGTATTMQVTAGSVSRANFRLAPATTLQFASAAAGHALPAALPVTWQFNTTGATVERSVAGTPETGLWPDVNGISAFAGSCADADPLSYSHSRASFALSGGGTSIAALDVAPVRIRGLDAAMDVTVEYVGPDSQCAFPAIVAGTSDAQGVVRVGLPYGQWRLSAGGQTRVLPDPLAPRADGTMPDEVTVSFSLADLDGACPSPSASPSPSPSPSPSCSPSGPA